MHLRVILIKKLLRYYVRDQNYCERTLLFFFLGTYLPSQLDIEYFLLLGYQTHRPNTASYQLSLINFQLKMNKRKR